MGLVDQYTARMYEEHRLTAAVPPVARYSLGDYGTLDGRHFTKAGSLGGLRAPIRVDADDEGVPAEETTLTSRGSNVFQFDIGANIDGKVAVNAGLKLAFESEYDFFLNLAGARYCELRNLREVMDELVRRAKLRGDDPDYWEHGKYRVITGMFKVQNLTAVIASKSSQSLELVAAVKTDVIDLGDPGLTLKVASGTIGSQKWITRRPGNPGEYFSPVFVLHKVNKTPFSTGWERAGVPSNETFDVAGDDAGLTVDALTGYARYAR